MTYKEYDRVMWKGKECIVAYIYSDTNIILELPTEIQYGWDRKAHKQKLENYQNTLSNLYYAVQICKLKMADAGRIINNSYQII